MQSAGRHLWNAAERALKRSFSHRLAIYQILRAQRRQQRTLDLRVDSLDQAAATLRNALGKHLQDQLLADLLLLLPLARRGQERLLHLRVVRVLRAALHRCLRLLGNRDGGLLSLEGGLRERIRLLEHRVYDDRIGLQDGLEVVERSKRVRIIFGVLLLSLRVVDDHPVDAGDQDRPPERQVFFHCEHLLGNGDFLALEHHVVDHDGAVALHALVYGVLPVERAGLRLNGRTLLLAELRGALQLYASRAAAGLAGTRVLGGERQRLHAVTDAVDEALERGPVVVFNIHACVDHRRLRKRVILAGHSHLRERSPVAVHRVRRLCPDIHLDVGVHVALEVLAFRFGLLLVPRNEHVVCQVVERLL